MAEVKSDATGYVLIAMCNGSGPEAFRTVGIYDCADVAAKRAREFAEREPGTPFGVFAKVGVAKSVTEIKWTTKDSS